MKFIMLFVVLLLVYLFYPFHDLYVKEDPFADTRVLVARGLWTEAACREEAEARGAKDFRCHRRSAWDGMFGAAVTYGQSEKVRN